MNAEDLRLGQIIHKTRTVHRDAVHVAVVPMVAGEELKPGQWISCDQGYRYIATGSTMSPPFKAAPLGIVDPFLREPVQPGDRFWCYLPPGSINGLRHQWHHPRLPSEAEAPPPPPDPSQAVKEAEEWLQHFCSYWAINYTELVEGGMEGVGVEAQGIELQSAKDLQPGEEQKFWECLEIVTGRVFNQGHRNRFIWSCSC